MVKAKPRQHSGEIGSSHTVLRSNLRRMRERMKENVALDTQNVFLKHSLE